MIEIHNVSFQYSNAEENSLKNLSLSIPEGQCVLLCGESGCGKTTITRLINGLVPHYYEGELSGTVTVKGLNVTESELYETAKIVGSVFQNPRSQFFCVDTTSEIAFGCENMGMPEQEILSRLNDTSRELGIENLLGRNIFELSGGEKQKIACASVSALQPDVFVLDEPTSNLDVNAIEDLKKTIKLWKSRGKTIVIAEHRLYWLTEICDRVIYMQNGSISFDIPMKEFRTFSAKKLSELCLRTLNMQISRGTDSQYTGNGTIELNDFAFSYEKTSALNIPKLSLPLGGIIAVIGDNGAGKSTFSRCLCGLEKSFKGSILQDGVTLRRKDMLKQCYMVMQDVNHQLFCETVEEEVHLGMDEDNERDVSAVLQSLDLENLTDRHPMSLSGGQKQRTAIASAILANKSILIFDEPTGGLDFRHMEQTGKMLLTLKGKKTLLIVTHDPELICRCCTHVLRLCKGEAAEMYQMDTAGEERLQKFFCERSSL